MIGLRVTCETFTVLHSLADCVLAEYKWTLR